MYSSKIGSKIILILVLFFLVILMSFNWNDYGLKLIDKKQIENGKTMVILEDENNNTFKIIYFNESDLDSINIINSINKIIFDLDFIKIKELKYFINSGIIDITLNPENVIINEKDYTQNFPAGLKFYYKDNLYFKLRIFSGNTFVQVENKFVSEDGLKNLIVKVIKDPDKYLKQSSTQYILSLLNTQAKQIEEYKQKLEELEKNIKTLEEKVDKNKNDYDKKIETINKYIAYLQDTALTLGNQGLFKGPTKISKEVVDSVIKLRTDNPKIETKEILEKLKAQNISASEWEIRLILLVFYNEF